ncbi:MAG TPA: hypothetical protein VEH28_05825 [Thermoplasmata archaeon]|nr:hypothetical protein [Thermoplasmata archaeon]
MSRTQESGAYLGGIGAMLQVSHGCPVCGQVHEGRKYGFKHRAPRECPLVITGNFPVVSLPAPSQETVSQLVTVARGRDGNGGTPVSVSILSESLRQVEFARPRNGERARGLGVPWLPPPDLGEVL